MWDVYEGSLDTLRKHYPALDLATAPACVPKEEEGHALEGLTGLLTVDVAQGQPLSLSVLYVLFWCWP